MKKPRLPLSELVAVACETPTPWRELFLALAETGARYSEMAWLTRECVELRPGRSLVHIIEHSLPDGSTWRPKRPSSIRTVFVRSELLGVQKVDTPTAYVFWPSSTSAPPTVRSANRRLSTAARTLGLPTPTTHDFRRARIVQALAAGGDPNTVRAAVGHRSLTSTLVYLQDVPLLAELPPMDAESRVNPNVAQYQQVFRKRNWTRG